MSKPLGHKSYGSIGHLPGSRLGSGDHSVNEGQAQICFTGKDKSGQNKKRRIVVQQKLDGSNVSVANIDGTLIALGRAGHTAASSPYLQHRMFNDWVYNHLDLFAMLKPGERLVGEWLAQAHGTRYALTHAPFVPFDIMRNGHERACYTEFESRVGHLHALPQLLATEPIGIDEAMSLVNPHHHGALDPVEGAVWRVEHGDRVEFLAKFVRHDKQDGKFLPDISGGPEVWNWRPE